MVLMSTKYSFNLLDKPWLPCIDLNGQYKQYSISYCLFNSQKIKGITCRNPLIEISLYRLLLAILHRNFGPKDADVWEDLYKNGWDNDVLKAYFKRWHDKFDLFGQDEDRFYQILPSEVKKDTPLSKLDNSISTGNNTALFDHHWDKHPESYKPGKCAQLLITFQNYAVSGGRSTPFYYSHAPLVAGISTIMKCENLFKTLIFNLIAYNENSPFKKNPSSEDIPFWERNERKLFEEKAGRYPNGYLDYLTWHSRRVWLQPYEDEGNLRVKYCKIAQGEKIRGDWHEAPEKTYMQKDGEYNALSLSIHRQVWRDTESILRVSGEKLSTKPPKVLEWISKLVFLKKLTFSSKYNLEIYGLCQDPTKVAKTLTWHHSHLPISQEILQHKRNKILVNILKDFIAKSEEIHKIGNKFLYRYLKDYLYPKSDSLSSQQRDNLLSQRNSFQYSEKFWSQLENRFYEFLVELPEKKGLAELSVFLRTSIEENVLPIAESLMNHLESDLLYDSRSLRAWISQKGFLYKLRKLFEN
ncbi:MAG: type I-E CRISPR-associated protein Cse1/CasA [Candidatus Lokiarchaeota archaeon]|nr:type I-E CRISPR-associated protein Cse1/CasA [Candidatus Lokiarchaeota archaeon]